jgi:uncharacterized membrane protein
MTEEALTTVVVGYKDTATALKDFHDLERAHKEGRLPSYDAAVVERATGSGHRLVATTIDPNRKRLHRGAGLGLVLGVIYSPALAVAAAGATIGAIAGSIVDDFASLKHADMDETHRLIDDSAANLIVICDSPHVQQLESVASSRSGRTILPLAPVDIQALKNELVRYRPALPGP